MKKFVVLTARVHPGESVGSWMMRGAINFITDLSNPMSKLLRENFVFKIIPMLNPDGVINGNYRCSLAGCDLNRRWKAPSKQLHPTVYAAKKLILSLQQEREIALFCDMHGHSRKPNVFVYACDSKTQYEQCRILPFILHKISPLFDYSKSTFGIEPTKEQTVRIQLFKELKTVA